jgi:hypothetical protein
MVQQMEKLQKYKEFSLMNPNVIKRAFSENNLFLSYGSN